MAKKINVDVVEADSLPPIPAGKEKDFNIIGYDPTTKSLGTINFDKAKVKYKDLSEAEKEEMTKPLVESVDEKKKEVDDKLKEIEPLKKELEDTTKDAQEKIETVASSVAGIETVAQQAQGVITEATEAAKEARKEAKAARAAAQNVSEQQGITEAAVDTVYNGKSHEIAREEIDKIQIGGVNLLTASQAAKAASWNSNHSQKYPAVQEKITIGSRECVRIKRTKIDLNPTIMSVYSEVGIGGLTLNEEFTIQFSIQASHDVGATSLVSSLGGQGMPMLRIKILEVRLGFGRTNVVSVTFSPVKGYDKLYFTFNRITIPEGEISDFSIVVGDCKIERGNKATDWTPAPEDVAKETEDIKKEVSDNKKSTTDLQKEVKDLKEALVELTKTVEELKTNPPKPEDPTPEPDPEPTLDTSYWIHKDTGAKTEFDAPEHFETPDWAQQAKEVYIAEGTTTLGSQFFKDCSDLLKIRLPNTLTGAKTWCLHNCTGLSVITLPSSFQVAEIFFMYKCTGLQRIESKAVVPPSLSESFDGVSKGIPVAVPAGSINAYREARTWKAFTNIVAL